MLFGKPHSFLGVDLGAGGVKVVELRKEKNRPVLFTYGLTSQAQEVHSFLVSPQASPARRLMPIEAKKSTDEEKSAMSAALAVEAGQAQKYAAVIRAVCKKARTRSKVAVVSLPVSAVFHAVVTLPALKKEEFDRVLKAEIRKLLPYALEETSLDYQVLAGLPEEKTRRVLVNAVPRSLVTFYAKIFEAAGLKLDSLEPESMALSRALVGRDQSVVMIIDLGAERTNFFIIEQGVPITHNSIDMGGARINQMLSARLGVDEAMVEQIKQDLFNQLLASPAKAGLDRQKFIDIFMGVMDPIIKEIEYSFDLFLGQSGNENKKPEKIILTGGAAHFPFLAELISDKFKIKSYIGDPWGRVIYQEKLRPLLRSVGPRLSVAIGLALRNVV